MVEELEVLESRLAPTVTGLLVIRPMSGTAPGPFGASVGSSRHSQTSDQEAPADIGQWFDSPEEIEPTLAEKRGQNYADDSAQGDYPTTNFERCKESGHDLGGTSR